jgi:hypothetical protein
MEIELLESKTLIVRSMDLEVFKLEVLMGPKMIDIYHQIKIASTAEFEFWNLGIHICETNFNYNVEKAIKETEKLLNDENRSFPFDSHCITSSYTNHILSNDPETSVFDAFLAAIETLRSKNRKFVFHLNSYILHDENNEIFNKAEDEKLLLLNESSDIFVGRNFNDQKISYLDYITKSEEIEKLLIERKKQMDAFKPDGYSIDYNYLFENVENASYKYLKKYPFVPENIKLSLQNIIPMNSKLANDKTLINFVNIYSSKQIELFKKVFNEKIVISDSYREYSDVGALIKDHEHNWVTFRKIVYKTVFYSTIGKFYYGSLVCGSNMLPVPEDLCIRWHQFSIYVPLFALESEKTPNRFTNNTKKLTINALIM